MRKRAKTTTKKPVRSTPRHERIALWLVLPFAASAGLLFLSYSNWMVTRQVGASAVVIAADKKQAQQYVEQGRINAAKRVEAAAAAAIKAEMQAKAENEAKVAAANAAKIPETQNTDCGTATPASMTVVINKKHCFSPLTWTPPDLGQVNGYAMRQQAATNMQNLMAAAAQEGIAINISSAYRSYDNQVVTYDNWVKVNGSVAAADTVSARPGYSEHQTGLAADLKVGECALECFGTTSAYPWMQKNAAKYGFIERYPSGLSAITGYAPEPWHWRYVGASTAQDMQAKGIKTLEQYFSITGGNY